MSLDESTPPPGPRSLPARATERGGERGPPPQARAPLDDGSSSASCAACEGSSGGDPALRHRGARSRDGVARLARRARAGRASARARRRVATELERDLERAIALAEGGERARGGVRRVRQLQADAHGGPGGVFADPPRRRTRAGRVWLGGDRGGAPRAPGGRASGAWRRSRRKVREWRAISRAVGARSELFVEGGGDVRASPNVAASGGGSPARRRRAPHATPRVQHGHRGDAPPHRGRGRQRGGGTLEVAAALRAETAAASGKTPSCSLASIWSAYFSVHMGRRRRATENRRGGRGPEVLSDA